MSLQDFAKDATGLSRNPLGIVALFIGFSEVMATLVLMGTHSSLSEPERVGLVGFLAAFPVVVFVTFVWLVVKHHTKLYGPKDYRDERLFLQLSTADQKLKIQEEVDEADTPDRPGVLAASGDVPTLPPARPTEPATTDTSSDTPPSAEMRRTRAHARYLLTEELVLRKMEAEWGVPLRRGARVGSSTKGVFWLDGLWLGPPETRVVEVKLADTLFFRSATLPKALDRLLSAAAILRSAKAPVRALLVVVTRRDSDIEPIRRRVEALLGERQKAESTEFELRIFDAGDLAAEFGVEIPELI